MIKHAEEHSAGNCLKVWKSINKSTNCFLPDCEHNNSRFYAVKIPNNMRRDGNTCYCRHCDKIKLDLEASGQKTASNMRIFQKHEKYCLRKKLKAEKIQKEREEEKFYNEISAHIQNIDQKQQKKQNSKRKREEQGDWWRLNMNNSLTKMNEEEFKNFQEHLEDDTYGLNLDDLNTNIYGGMVVLGASGGKRGATRNNAKRRKVEKTITEKTTNRTNVVNNMTTSSSSTSSSSTLRNRDAKAPSILASSSSKKVNGEESKGHRKQRCLKEKAVNAAGGKNVKKPLKK